MKLKELIKNLSVIKVEGSLDVEIRDIKIESNQVGKDSLFICINGNNFDGHEFIRQVECYGASAVITQRRLDTRLTQIIINDCRDAMSVLARDFYGNVDKKMKLIAVVGTNGKTTTAHLIKNVLERSGEKCGVIGTLGSYYSDVCLEPSLTTPDPIELNEILAKMYKSGVTTVVMEVSAHALYYGKVKGLKFWAGVFTNFSQDHLDFFNDMESYKQAKLKFFRENQCEFVVVNSDDSVGVEICSICDKAITYGIENPADVFAIDVNCASNGLNFVINLFDCIYDVKLKLIGKFNIYNALATASVCALFGVKPCDVVKHLEQCKNVSGRLEKVYNQQFNVYIDYAHTPDGLEKVLSAVRDITEKRLICVFGCGGNRDKLKRAVMGEISAQKADVTVITSDNPRYEEPMEIIRDIEKGVLKTNKRFISIEDREEAIIYALNMAKEGDSVVICGKGGEKYQEVLGIKKLYNDKDTVNKYFGRT